MSGSNGSWRRGLVPFIVSVVSLWLTLQSPAKAVVPVALQSHGQQLDTSFSTATHLGVDIGWTLALPVALELELEAADVGAVISFDAVLSDFSGGLLRYVALDLIGGAVFDAVGDAVALEGHAAQVQRKAAQVLLTLAPPSNELYLGDPFDLGGTDWRIGMAGLKAGERFTLRLTPVSEVPEPRTLSMMVAGLLAFGFMVQRRMR